MAPAIEIVTRLREADDAEPIEFAEESHEAVTVDAIPINGERFPARVRQPLFTANPKARSRFLPSQFSPGVRTPEVIGDMSR